MIKSTDIVHDSALGCEQWAMSFGRKNTGRYEERSSDWLHDGKYLRVSQVSPRKFWSVGC